MERKILTSVKGNLGLAEDYTVYDGELITYINTAISTLTQLGVGPSLGFYIEGYEQSWDELIGTDPQYNSVKTYIYLRVRLLFDPPTTSFAITAFEDQLEEIEWRLNVYREGTAWADPVPTTGGDDDRHK